MKIRWGVISCGDIVRKRVAQAMRDSSRSDFIAVSRAKAEQVEECARQLGARKGYRDWRDVIRDPEIGGDVDREVDSIEELIYTSAAG